MNRIEGYQTKITPKKCKDSFVAKPHVYKEINFLMDCPEEYFKNRKIKTK